MICQNCQTDVDNDLVFCTNCGTRLNETWNQTPTVLGNDSVVTKPSVQTGRPNSNSNLKWIALIVALIAIPASLFGGYLLLNSNRQSSAQNTDKQISSNSTSNKKADTNQNKPANLSNIADTNENTSNSNVNAENTNTDSGNSERVEIMNERIEIEPDSPYTLPFTVDYENARIKGNVQVLRGQPLDGYVYLQEMYDLHFPDTTYKMFSFDVTKNSDINQTLVKGNYVLVFSNKNAKSSIIQSKVVVESMEK